jgi:hypothetical protein
MTIQETREVILLYFENNQNFLNNRTNHKLQFNNNGYRIRPDDAFYFPDQVLLFEYENNKRPVESISKYFWLLKETAWLNENVKIKLLLTINNETVGNNEIRVQSIKILGNILNQQYPNNFDFHFLNYNELTEENLLAELEKMNATK